MTQVYAHRETGELVLITPCYFKRKTFYTPTMELFGGVGVIFENSHGIHFLMPHKILEHLDLIGDFE